MLEFIFEISLTRKNPLRQFCLAPPGGGKDNVLRDGDGDGRRTEGQTEFFLANIIIDVCIYVIFQKSYLSVHMSTRLYARPYFCVSIHHVM